MEYVFGILLLATLITLIWCIVLSIKLHDRTQTLKKHDKCARHFASKISAIRNKQGDNSLDNISTDVEEMLKETHGVVSYLKSLCWVVIPFCLVISILYLATHFPRLISEPQCEAGQSSYAHLGIDYLGIIVSIFAVVVTILVGWQIFNNIKERERLEQVEKENHDFQSGMNTFRRRLEKRVQKVDDCCDKRKKEIKTLDDKVENLTSATLLMASAQSLIKSSRFTDSEHKTDTFLISTAYSTLFNATYKFIKANTNKNNILGCISSLKTCIMMLSVDNVGFIKE